jgi:hypothetical protein
MVKQRFLVPFRRWLVTVAKVFGPILLFEGFVSVRQYLRLTPLGALDLLMDCVGSGPGENGLGRNCAGFEVSRTSFGCVHEILGS